MLARALLLQPELIVLDEVTNALSPTDEASIMDGVGQLSSERTIIVIAHRLFSVRRADEIVVPA